MDPAPSYVPQHRRPAIERRRVRQDYQGIDERFFYDGNPLLSTFIAALSAVFPPGEREFVRSVANYRDQIPKNDALAEAVRDFASQEGQHAHQHREANRALDAWGYKATESADELTRLIDERYPQRTHAQRLALTAGAEHLTAILGHYVLTHPHVLDPLPPAMRRLFIWHAVEEIEHKAVAFDVYDRCVGDRRQLRLMFLLESVLFVRAVASVQWWMLRQQRARPTWRDVKQAARIFLGPGGIVPSIAGHFSAYLRSDFHPWQVDDRALIARWKSELEGLDAAA